MEGKKRKIIFSRKLKQSLEGIYFYGVQTFGTNSANYFIDEVFGAISDLSTKCFLHPECNHIPTKSKIYRNIIIGSYLIIYRIKPESIEVLIAIHGRQSPSKIKKYRSLKL